MDKEYIGGYGNGGANIAIVTDHPSFEDVGNKKLFSGPDARFLASMLKTAGINMDSCWLTAVSKYYITPSPKKKRLSLAMRAQQDGINLDEQLDDLRKELLTIRPNVIIALGSSALWALTGKTKIQSWRGSKMLGFGIKVIPTFKPADVLYQSGEVTGFWQKQILTFDFKRAFNESGSSELKLPTRHLQIIRNTAEFYDFLKQYKDSSYPSIDIEAAQCIPNCIGISFNPHHGVTIPLWNKGFNKNLSQSELASMWIMLAEFLAKHEVIGQNFGYDRDKIKRLGFIIKALRSDTMLKAFVINPELPKNLAFNTSIYTEEPYYKDEGMYEGSEEDLFIGCARDACVTKEIDIAQEKDLEEMGLTQFYYNFILKLHDLYAHIENVGLHVNIEKRKELIKKYVEWDEQVRHDLFKLSGQYINSSSPKQVAEQLFKTWGLPERKGVGEEELTALLNTKFIKKQEQRDFITNVLEDRRIKKTLSSHLTSPTDFDGRMRTSYYLCLETGRTATQQQEPPIRPLILTYDEMGKKKKRAMGTAFQTMTKHGDIGADVRSQYEADEGYVFLQADSSQAEARVIFLLAQDYEALELIDTHDFHALTASWFFGGVEDDYSKKKLGYESPIRFAGKTLRHAGHLGAKARRATIECNTQARKYKIDLKIDEKQAERALNIFHQKQPKIRGVFQAEVIKCVEATRRLTAPVPYGIDAPKGGTRIFYERYGDELFRQAFSYLPQRTVSENTKAAGLRIHNAHSWVKIVGESHDALLFLVPLERELEAGSIIKTEFERPIDFSTCSLPRGELIIPCEIERGFNYHDLKKFKFEVV